MRGPTLQSSPHSTCHILLRQYLTPLPLQSLTCRRRHIRCDEAKPHCGACTKKHVRCEYANPEGRPKVKASRSSQSQTDNGINSTHGGRGVPSISLEYSDQPSSLLELSNNLLEPFPHTTSCLHEGPSRTQVPYALTPSYGDRSELINSSKPGESPTSRWLDLLIADANDWASLERYLEPNGLDIFGNSVTQTPEITPPGSPGPPGPPPQENDDGNDYSPTASTVSPLPRHAYLLERAPCNAHQLREEQAWAAQDPIELRPAEHILFKHFVERISQWVFHVRSIKRNSPSELT